MSTIQIIDNNQETNSRLKIGESTLHFMDMQKGIDDDGKAVIIDEAMHILKQCIKPGVKDSITNIAVGYVQSGKTLSFTTLTALAADNGYRVIIYLTGTKTNLQEQTSSRLRKDLDVEDTDTYRLYSDIMDSVSVVNNVKNFISRTDEVLLFPILKHYVHISRLATIFAQLKQVLQGVGAIIVDDEADQSSFNTYARKNAKKKDDWDEDDFSKTYSAILELKKVLPSHSYIQYTATPQAAFLIDNNDILSPKYHTVLTPGKGYTGGKTFFKDTERNLVEIIPEDQVYHHKNNPLTTMPETLVEALQEFLISIAIVVLIQKRTKFLSMMIHIDGIRKSNKKFAKWSSERIQNWFELLTVPDKDPGKSMTINSFRKPYNNIVKYMSDAPSFEDVMSKMEKAIIYTEVHLVQGGSETTIEWKASKGHILVGADMLNRGFTIENLSMTYMPRSAKGRATADTIEQRCRFFGYKSKYIDVCRVYLPAKSVRDYNDYVDHEETLRTSLKQCSSIADFASHPSSMLLAETLNPTRTNILSKKLIRTKMSGWRQMRSLDYIEENNKSCKDFLAEWNNSEFTLFKDYDNNVMRNHRYVKCKMDIFIKFFKSIKYMDVQNITRKIVTLQYLAYLKETKGIDYVYIFEMAFGANHISEMRKRKLEKDLKKPINLMAGRAENGTYDGDDKIYFDDAVCVQLHHVRIDQPLHKLNNKDLYNIVFYYPQSIANSFVGVEDNDEDEVDD